MENDARRWREWSNPTVLIALLSGLLAGGATVYATGARDAGMEQRVVAFKTQIDDLQKQVQDVKSTMATRDAVNNLSALYASKGSVDVLQSKFEGYQLFVSDKLTGIQTKVDSTEKLLQELNRRVR